ncbi:MAG: hypothetical protein M1480_06145 [Bacteroidetes bacterium]|nr:hypothetical protein [Bacteroidota bacterium]
MKKTMLLFVLFVVATATLPARVVKVDINGSGQFTSISAALTNAVAGDTIKVLPGSYTEQITINKNVIVIGSGFETTIINSALNPTVNISAGKIQWFTISSTSGDGIQTSGSNGIISNCVIRGCILCGVYTNTAGSSASVINCVLADNGSYGIEAANTGKINATNCIAKWNGPGDFWGDWYNGGILNLSYCDGSNASTNGNQGCINLDPQFVSTSDLHISQGSPCWDKGNPSLLDPDGSPSDMGYFGGPDCPIYPVVKAVKIIPQPDGSIQIQATGVANY